MVADIAIIAQAFDSLSEQAGNKNCERISGGSKTVRWKNLLYIHTYTHTRTYIYIYQGVLDHTGRANPISCAVGLR